MDASRISKVPVHVVVPAEPRLTPYTREAPSDSHTPAVPVVIAPLVLVQRASYAEGMPADSHSGAKLVAPPGEVKPCATPVFSSPICADAGAPVLTPSIDFPLSVTAPEGQTFRSVPPS